MSAGKRQAISWSLVVAVVSVVICVAAWRWPVAPKSSVSDSQPQIYSIRVQVLDPEGNPMSAATIRGDVQNEPQRTPDGWWEFEVPLAKVPYDGRITLWAEADGWRGGSQTVLLGADPNPTVAISLLPPESRLAGNVESTAGSGIEGATVTATDVAIVSTVTDLHGRFQLTLPVPRDTQVRIRAEHPDFDGVQNFCYSGRDQCSLVMNAGE